ncbi:Uncharacterized protein TCM_016779 [Theobroma cacao]|uniref:RNase H type-1 domain-containing protein n=1 Tax=Theobroma cacao TaxID=3641 RepID=A0A061EJ01_THECC|nr:Uncharacterized protein TCM_016779 [Theobroma cacao]
MAITVSSSLFSDSPQTIWFSRNDLIFNGKLFDIFQIFDVIKLKVGWWAKAKWPPKNSSVMDVVSDPSYAKASVVLKKNKLMTDWIKPPNGCMKFNVDETARGYPRDAAISGVLCDNNGSIKILFSKSVGIFYSNFAEIFTIKETFLGLTLMNLLWSLILLMLFNGLTILLLLLGE